MKEPYIEGIANHDGPESCTGTREGAGEALTGARAGWLLSREIQQFRVLTLLTEAEDNTAACAFASVRPALRGRPHVCALRPLYAIRKLRG